MPSHRKPVPPTTVGGLPAAHEPMAAAANTPKPASRLATIRKAVVAFLAGSLGWVATCYIPDGHVSRPEWYALAVIVVGVLGVHQIPNAPAPAPTDGEAGYTLLEVLAAVVLIVLAAVGLLALLGVHISH